MPSKIASGWLTRVAGCTIAITAALVTGCATNTVDEEQARSEIRARMPELDRTLFQPRRDVPDFAQLVRLTAEQEEEFQRFFGSGVNARYRPHKRIHVYLSRHLSDIEFGNRTLSAAETIGSESGNCMSLALVTTALARSAGVEVGWQLANTDPVYSSEGSVIYSANHIQVRLYEERLAKTGYAFSLGRDYLLLDYFTDDLPEHGRELAENEMIALVYQNLGVEAMAEGDLDEAFWLLFEGLAHDPLNPNLYNALGVLHRRAGDEATAEALYRFALDEFGDRLIILRNYRKLLLAQDRREDADRMEQRMLVLPDPDPYPILALGDEAMEAGRPGTALAYYRKASKVAPYLHEIYWKIADVHYSQGDERRAEKELEKARRKAWAEDDKQRYQAKLNALNGLH